MNKVFILFWCDLHHNYDSKRIAGVFDDFDKAYDEACKIAKRNGNYGLGNHEKFMLKNYKQTQNRMENYIIEEWEINKPIKSI